MTTNDEILSAFSSLGKKINKALGNENTLDTEEGIVSEKLPELALTMSNEKLIALTTKWDKKWITSDVYAQWVAQGDDNEKYWLGNHFNRPKLDKSRPLVDNVIFEALETYLPQATQRNPDATVDLARGVEPTPENLAYAKNLKEHLAEIGDEIVLRLKLKKAARHWAIYLLGAVKFGWDMNKDMPTLKIVRGRKLILDPDATNDEDGYSGEYVGEYRKLTAGNIIKMLEAVGGEEEGIKSLKELVEKDTGTDVQFIEWWTNEYMCWTMGKQVLLKKKNPHWNYDEQQDVPTDEQGNPVLDEQGNQSTTSVPGVNHFAVPSKPYRFLTVFNLGKQPVDDTSLIGQGLAGQDLVNKRLGQLDKNIDSMNGGMVVSGERSGLTQAQAKGVTEALRRGGTVWIPNGDVTVAVTRMSAPSLPGDVYTQLQDTRARMRDVFGTSGSSVAGVSQDRTVRGKLQAEKMDSDRIGGGFSEYLEQFADDCYNWIVQLLYVYDDTYAGKELPKVKISVKAGSLLPKDSNAIASQSIELASANKMSTIDLYKNLDFPNPEELAANAWLELNAPEVLFANDPRIAQVMQQRSEAAQPEPRPVSESINFKDLPPDGQTQMAAKVGIDLNPEAIAAYNENVEERSKPPIKPETK